MIIRSYSNNKIVTDSRFKTTWRMVQQYNSYHKKQAFKKQAPFDGKVVAAPSIPSFKKIALANTIYFSYLFSFIYHFFKKPGFAPV